MQTCRTLGHEEESDSRRGFLQRLQESVLGFVRECVRRIDDVDAAAPLVGLHGGGGLHAAHGADTDGVAAAVVVVAHAADAAGRDHFHIRMLAAGDPAARPTLVTGTRLALAVKSARQREGEGPLADVRRASEQHCRGKPVRDQSPFQRSDHPIPADEAPARDHVRPTWVASSSSARRPS